MTPRKAAKVSNNVFAAKKVGGELKSNRDKFYVSFKGDLAPAVDPYGNDLIATLRNNKHDPVCHKCQVDIPYGTRCVTSVGKNVNISYCPKCMACEQGHVLHLRTIKEQLDAKRDRCSRCGVSNLSKLGAVKWCVECEHAFCPNGCRTRSA